MVTADERTAHRDGGRPVSGHPIDLDALLEDEGLDELFAQLEDVGADAGLRSSTLAAMMDAVGEPAVRTVAQSAREEKADQGSDASVIPGRDVILAVESDGPGAGSRSRGAHFAPSAHRRRPGTRRIASIVAGACLAFGALGGAAYAIPTSYVSVEGSSTYELAIDIFGLTVSAIASDEAGEAVLAVADVCNKVYGSSIDALMEAIDEESVSVVVSGNNQGQKSSLVADSQAALRKNGRNGTVHDVDADMRKAARDADLPIAEYLERRGDVDAMPSEGEHAEGGPDVAGGPPETAASDEPRGLPETAASDWPAPGDAPSDAAQERADMGGRGIGEASIDGERSDGASSADAPGDGAAPGEGPVARASDAVGGHALGSLDRLPDSLG